MFNPSAILATAGSGSVPSIASTIECAEPPRCVNSTLWRGHTGVGTTAEPEHGRMRARAKNGSTDDGKSRQRVRAQKCVSRCRSRVWQVADQRADGEADRRDRRDRPETEVLDGHRRERHPGDQRRLILQQTNTSLVITATHPPPAITHNSLNLDPRWKPWRGPALRVPDCPASSWTASREPSDRRRRRRRRSGPCSTCNGRRSV